MKVKLLYALLRQKRHAKSFFNMDTFMNLAFSNEIIFALHCIAIAVSVLIALRMGKEALTTFVVINGVLANIFVIKQINIFGFNATTTDAFTIGAVVSANLIHEYFGAYPARKALYISTFIALLVTLLTQIQLWYLPSEFDQHHEYFSFIFSHTPRVIFASLSAYFIAQVTENILYAFFKDFFNDKFILLRNWLTICFTQLVDTCLFSFLALYGVAANITHIIILSFCIKIIALICMSPAITLSKKIIAPVAE